MTNATIEKTSATTKGGTHLNSNNYSTSCTRSASYAPITKADIAIEWMKETFGFYMIRMTITPEMAKEILDCMGANRGIKSTGVSRYTSAMEKGNWRLSPQGIVFDDEGILIDGQHRLESVIRSGVPEDFLVFIGVSKDTPIDKNIPRSDEDSLRIRGVCSPDVATRSNMTIVKNFFSAKFSTKASSGMNEDDRAYFLNKYSDAITFSRLTSNRGDSHGIAAKAGVQVAILAAVMCGAEREKLEEFLVSINSMEFKSGSPAKVIYKTLSDMRMNGGVSIMMLEGMMEEAIFDFLNDNPRTQRYKGLSHPFLDKIPAEEVLA